MQPSIPTRIPPLLLGAERAEDAAKAAGYANDSHTMKLARAIDKQIEVTRKLIADRAAALAPDPRKPK